MSIWRHCRRSVCHPLKINQVILSLCANAIEACSGAAT